MEKICGRVVSALFLYCVGWCIYQRGKRDGALEGKPRKPKCVVNIQFGDKKESES